MAHDPNVLLHCIHYPIVNRLRTAFSAGIFASEKKNKCTRSFVIYDFWKTRAKNKVFHNGFLH